MNEEISRIKIQNEQDVVLAYRRAMQISELTGMLVSSQRKFATAVSEICRNVLEHAGIGTIRFKIIREGSIFIEAIVSDKGRGISNIDEILSKKFSNRHGKGCGILNAKRLVDRFNIESEHEQGTKVTMRNKIPDYHPPFNILILKGWKQHFEKEIAVSPYEEIKRQNTFLLEMMETLRVKNIESEHQIEEIKRLNYELDQFAHTVSHDLKAPLRNIEGLNLIVKEGAQQSNFSEIIETSDMINHQILRMDKLINDILIYSKSERGKLEKSEVDLKELIASIISSLSVPEGFQITVDVDCSTIFTEEIYLIQIFTNLLNNSIKHHDRDNGLISIGCSQEQSLHTFFVSDDGPGIPFENQNKIFKIFEGADLGKVDSTGVGLSIVKKIVNDKGGKIWIESDGRGTKFIFTWPNHQTLHSN